MSYCLTSNHVHLLLRACDPEELASFMQLVAGGMAQAYNLRKRRQGAFWSDRYHATMIEDGEHLWRCLRYIDLNMVRAGVVEHPSEWEWTGWGELMGERRRNKLLNMAAVLAALDVSELDVFRLRHREQVENALRVHELDREPRWSESVAIGGSAYTECIARELRRDYTRKRLDRRARADGAWVLRENTENYGAEKASGK